MSNDAMLLTRVEPEIESDFITELEKALLESREQLKQEQLDNEEKAERLQKLFDEIVVFQETIKQHELKEEKLTSELESVMLELANSKMQVSKYDKQTGGIIASMKRRLVIAYAVAVITVVLTLVSIVLGIM